MKFSNIKKILIKLPLLILMVNNSKLRNLAERKQLNIIKGDYLLIIYGFNNTVSPNYIMLMQY